VIGPRWRKLARDVWSTRYRTAAMVVAIAVSVAALTAFLTARVLLGRAMSDNYLAGRPASAVLHVPGGVGAEELRTAEGVPGVLDAAARGTVQTRVRIGDGPWRTLVLFVSADDDAGRVAVPSVEQGRWPPGGDQLFLERTAVPYLGADVGDRLTVRAAGGRDTTMTVAGTVHDAGVAPAEQERTAYGRVTASSLAALGRPADLTQLAVIVGGTSGPSGDRDSVEATARQVGAALGRPVTGIDVPAPLRHPHHGQMLTVGFLMLGFGVLALILSSVLVATMLGGVLAEQTRQIGAMKAVGARTGQLLGMYLALGAAVAVAATALGLYPGVLLGRVLAGASAGILNLDLGPGSAPPWGLAVSLTAGIVVPLVVVALPILRGVRRSVRETLDDHGTARTGGPVGRALSRLARAARTSVTVRLAVGNVTRRQSRLVLSVVLLAVAGAAFLTAANTAAGWDALARDGIAHRHYDLELRLDEPTAAGPLVARALAVPGVRSAEGWGREHTAVAVDGQVPVERVYPDDVHGSFSLLAPPAGSTLLTPPVRSGRWLRAGDENAVVLNTLAAVQQAPGTEVGDDVTLSVAGRTVTWRVVGIVSDFGSQAVAYTTDRQYAAVVDARDAGVLRVVTDSQDPAARTAVLDRLTDDLDSAGVPVEQAFTVDELRTGLDEHVNVLVTVLVALGLVIGLVGLLGLGSAMTASVTERTWEFAVAQTLGATPRRIRSIVMLEGVLIASASLLLAVLAALPLTAAFAALFGRTAFAQPLPFTIAVIPLVIWAVLLPVGAALATAAAARRASSLTIRQALTVL
jgi:putative ABC transport system permease protein